jgi:prephenate dehydratase
MLGARHEAGSAVPARIDIEGHPGSENVRHALEELRKGCGFFKILGTCPVDVH